MPDERLEPYRHEEALRDLRDSLTDDMARKAFGIRYHREPMPPELAEFKELLVKEHYDEGFDRWIEKYLYFDPRAHKTRAMSQASVTRRQSPAFFVANKLPYRQFRAPKQYEVQLLDRHGQAKASGYFDSADEEMVLEGVRVDRRVLVAAMAQVEGQGTYVNEVGDPVQMF
jgi:hypothetical protein